MPEQLDVGLAGKDIQSLVEEMEQGKIVLPDFQRDFVWPTKQVGKLLESILNGYYINTLLTLPVVTGSERGAPFPPRTAEGVVQKDGTPFDIQMVLDGQQRITSIYYALSAPDIPLDNTQYPQVFCLKLSKVINGELDEDSIIWRRGDWDSTQRLVDSDLQFQVEKDLVPFTVFKSKTAFKEWRRGMERLSEGSFTLTKDDIDAFEDNTEVLRNYKIPIVQLGADTPESKVVQTFERINTQGLELGVFDILTARLWTEDIRLRDLWEGTLDTYPRIKTYSDDAGEQRLRELILKTLALYRGDECKDRFLRKLDPSNFDADWAKATQMLDRLLKKAKSDSSGGFGVTERFGFPYTAMLPPLANLLYVAEEAGTYPSADALQKIHRWYWCSVFSKRYSGSSDTKSYEDLHEMKTWLDDDSQVPDPIQEAPRRIPVELGLETLTRGGLYKGIMSLLVLNGAKDFGTFESIALHEIDDHHIFPNSRLKQGINGKKYEDKNIRNRILNRTIIEARSNRFKYRDELPTDYIPKMIKEHSRGEEGVKELLQGHLINDDAFEALLSNNYEDFCTARKQAIRQAIEERVGEEITWQQAEQTQLL